MAETGRVYGGRSEDERRADRRGRLVGAGLVVFGTEGWSGATIEKLCAAAGVATRSFYEEFSSREALLRAVYEAIMDGVTTTVLPVVQDLDGPMDARVRAGLTAYVDYMTKDPRRARIANREVRIAGVLEADRHAMVLRFASFITRTADLGPGEAGRLPGVALAGAVTEVLVDWVAHPEPRPDTGPMVEALSQLFIAAIARTDA